MDVQESWFDPTQGKVLTAEQVALRPDLSAGLIPSHIQPFTGYNHTGERIENPEFGVVLDEESSGSTATRPA